MVDEFEWQLSGGMFLFVPSLCVHSFDFDPGTEGTVFSLPSGVVTSVTQHTNELALILSKPFANAITASLETACTLLVNVDQSHSKFRSQSAVSLSQTILSLIAETQSSQTERQHNRKTTRLEILDKLIAEHQSEGWSASDYANALSVSTGHLSRLCRDATGVGAAAYVEQKVMAEACRLLAFTQLPVSEVGYRLGYNDPSYFSKRFAIAQGKSPSTYRAGFAN